MEPFAILNPTDSDLQSRAREAAETLLKIIHDGVPTGPKIQEDPVQKGKRWILEDLDIIKPLVMTFHRAKVSTDTSAS